MASGMTETVGTHTTLYKTILIIFKLYVLSLL